LNIYPNISSQPCCTQLQLLSYLSNELGAQESAKVEHHFTNCALCSDAIDGLFSLSDEERKALMDNENPFVKEEIKPLQVGYKKNKIWKIASVLLLIMGVGFGMYQFNNRHDGHSIAKNENAVINNIETSKETSSETTIANIQNTEGAKIDATKDVVTNGATSTIKSASADCPPEMKKVIPTTIVAETEANKYKDFEKTLENKTVTVNENEEQKVEAKAIEKMVDKSTASNDDAFKKEEVAVKKEPSKNVLPAPVSSNLSNNNYLNNTANSGSATYTDGVATNTITSTKVMENVTIAKADKKKTASRAKADNDIVKQGTYDMDGKLSANETLNKPALDAIESRFNSKKYMDAIELAEAFLQTKAGAYNYKAMYYLAMSYSKINDTKKAREWMEKVARSNSEFAKSAKNMLADWNNGK
jgi:hypothetical protein